MSGGAKVVLGIIVGLIALGAVAVAAVGAAGLALFNSLEKSSEGVATLATNIADFDLPEDYDQQYGLSVLGGTFVAYEANPGHSHIMLLQVPPGLNLDQEEMERQMFDQVQPQYRDRHDRSRLRLVGKQKMVIGGETVTMTVREGSNGSGRMYREMAGIFEGKSGPALLAIGGEIADWDKAEIDAFVASIR